MRRSSSISRIIQCAQHTFPKVFEADVVELFHLLHDELLLINLHNQGSAACIASRKTKFTKGVLQRLGDINCAGLVNSPVIQMFKSNLANCRSIELTIVETKLCVTLIQTPIKVVYHYVIIYNAVLDLDFLWKIFAIRRAQPYVVDIESLSS